MTADRSAPVAEPLTAEERGLLDRLIHERLFTADSARLEAVVAVVERIVAAREAAALAEGERRGRDEVAAAVEAVLQPLDHIDRLVQRSSLGASGPTTLQKVRAALPPGSAEVLARVRVEAGAEALRDVVAGIRSQTPEMSFRDAEMYDRIAAFLDTRADRLAEGGGA